MNKGYEIFSRFYDQYIIDTAPELHQKYLNLIEMIFKNFNIKAEELLDATCGTGILMTMLKEKGYSIEGMDGSAEMLKVAMEKDLKVHHGDLRGFNLGKKYDCILSFDSLGHITNDKDLVKTLINIENHLNRGGIFICDGGTREKANRMIGQEYIYQSNEYSFIWTNQGVGPLVEVELNIKDHQAGNEYIESFQLLGHDLEDMIEAAKETKLKLIFATLEPLVKSKGSFIAVFSK